MGAEISSNRDQADALDMYRDWNIKQATELLKKYKKNDYEFGLDQAALGEFLGDDEKSHEQADKVLKAFDRGAGMINALEFLIAVIVVCEAKREEKTGALGICTGLKGESDEDLVESITQKKFQKTDKVGKEDYFKFVQDDLDLFNMNKMSDETLQCFGVKQPEIIQVSEEEKQKQLEQELEKELEQKLNVNDDETKEDAPKATPPSQEETNVEDNKKPPPTTEEEQNNIETTTPSPPTNTNATATVVPTEAEKTDDGVEKLPKTNVIVDGTGNKVVVGEV